jgi:hypothetical protein
MHSNCIFAKSGDWHPTPDSSQNNPALFQSENELLENYPGLTREDILACLSYASYLTHKYEAYPIPA